MSKLKKQIVLDAIYSLKENSNNKLWGLISLFIATENAKEIQPNSTYITKADILSEILQDLFYFGTSVKTFNSSNQLFFRLSKNWTTAYLLITKSLGISLIKKGQPLSHPIKPKI